MKATVCYLLMLQKKYQFKAKDSEMKPYPLCLCNILRHFRLINMKQTGLKGVAKVILLIIMLLILTMF